MLSKLACTCKLVCMRKLEQLSYLEPVYVVQYELVCRASALFSNLHLPSTFSIETQ